MLVVVIATSACVGAPAPRIAPGASRTLTVLRDRLARVHAAARGDDVSLGGDLPLGDLVGLPQTTLRDVLGAPRLCTGPRPPAPCERSSDWFYSFYHLPQSEGFITIGGGPELWLQFDALGQCTQAAWRHTQ